MSLHRLAPMASVRSFAIALASMMMLIGSLHPTLSRASEELGAFLGAMDTEHPGWFKERFLDFEEDIDEAAADGRRLLLYFWHSGCPLCHALI